MQKITPFLWFDNNAEEAVNFYLSIFKDAKILSVSRYGDAGPGPAGSIMVIKFRLQGQEFLALNGGPHFKFTEAISLTVNCETAVSAIIKTTQSAAGVTRLAMVLVRISRASNNTTPQAIPARCIRVSEYPTMAPA